MAGMSTKAGKQMTYLWIPGTGPDAQALRRLQEHARKPARPMGEAWFMAEHRRFFTELLTDDASRWERELIETALMTLTSGPGCFGLRREWSDWLHYLTPRLLGRIDGPQWKNIYESLISAFMARYPDERSEYPYDRFLEDTLATLGRMPMAPSNWNDGGLVMDGLIPAVEEMTYGLALFCGGTFSAALFLHLKYLDEGLLPDWLASVQWLIEDAVWRVKMVLWVAKSRELLLQSGQQPGVLEMEPSYGSGWDGCWGLMGSNPSPEVDPSQIAIPFLSDARRQCFQSVLRRHLTRASLERLGAEVAEAEEAQPRLYGIRVQFDQAVREIVLDYQLR